MIDGLFSPRSETFGLNELISEVDNTLRYSLRIEPRINSDKIHQPTDAGYIEEIAKIIIERISKIAFISGDASFFGQDNSLNSLKYSKRIAASLYSLDPRDEWTRIFLEDALIEILALFRESFCANRGRGLSGYEALRAFHEPLVSETNGKEAVLRPSTAKICGFHAKVNDRSLQLDAEFPYVILPSNKKNTSNSQTAHKKVVSWCSDYKKKCIQLSKRLDEVHLSHAAFLNAEKSAFYVGNADLLAYLFKHREAVATICQNIEGKSKTDLQESIRTLSTGVQNEPMLTNTDKLYIQASIERTFHFSASAHLLDCINRTKSYDLKDAGTVSALSMCFMLPNSFTSKYIIDMAFDSIDTQPIEIDRDFFVSYLDTKKVVNFTTKTPEPYGLDNWLPQYKAMMYYLSNFAFPLFRSCFLIAWYDFIRQTLDAGTRQNEIETPDKPKSESIFETMYMDLCKYLDGDGYDKLVCWKGSVMQEASDLFHQKNGSEKPEEKMSFSGLYYNAITGFKKLDEMRPKGRFITLQYLDNMAIDTVGVAELYSTEMKEESPRRVEPIMKTFQRFVMDAGHLGTELRMVRRPR